MVQFNLEPVNRYISETNQGFEFSFQPDYLNILNVVFQEVVKYSNEQSPPWLRHSIIDTGAMPENL